MDKNIKSIIDNIVISIIMKSLFCF